MRIGIFNVKKQVKSKVNGEVGVVVMRSAVLFLLVLGVVAQASAALTSRCYVRDGLVAVCGRHTGDRHLHADEYHS